MVDQFPRRNLVMSVLEETFKCRTYQVQADSPSIRLTFIDGEVNVVNRNTFLDVDVLSPDSTQAPLTGCLVLIQSLEEVSYDLK